MNRLTRWHRTLAISLCLLLVSIAQPVHAGATKWMDIEVLDGFLVLETEVAGIPGYSFIDTGADFSAINKRFLESHDLTFKKGRHVKVHGVFSESKRSTYRSIPGKIFDAPINLRNMVELELGTEDIQLLLGANFLDVYIFQFDYPNQRMRLITRDSVDLESIQNVEAKKDRNGGNPLIRVNLNGEVKRWLLMDTGANGGLIMGRDLARRLDWLGAYPTVEGQTSGALVTRSMEYFKVPSIQVGPFRIEDVLVSVPARGVSSQFFDGYVPLGTRIPRNYAPDGILGFDILQHFVVTIDYEKGHIHLYPGEKEPPQGSSNTTR